MFEFDFSEYFDVTKFVKQNRWFGRFLSSFHSFFTLHEDKALSCFVSYSHHNHKLHMDIMLHIDVNQDDINNIVEYLNDIEAIQIESVVYNKPTQQLSVKAVGKQEPVEIKINKEK